MTTPATAASRRLATAALTGVFLAPVGWLVAAPAYADDPVPSVSATPTVGIGEPTFVEAPAPTPSASDWPESGGWIIGGTLQEGTAAGPKAAPARIPVTAPAKQAAVPVVRPATVSAPVARPQTVLGPVAAAAPTALPFTGPDRLTTQITVGAGLVLLGVVLTAAAGTKGTFAQSR